MFLMEYHKFQATFWVLFLTEAFGIMPIVCARGFGFSEGLSVMIFYTQSV